MEVIGSWKSSSEPPLLRIPLALRRRVVHSRRMAIEPIHRPRSTEDTRGVSNPYEGRWRWWYSAISDWMLRNPGGTMADCAAELGRGASTCLLYTSPSPRD